MNSIAQELNLRLATLDAHTPAHVGNLVREALALVERNPVPGGKDWPAGYFEETCGDLARERFERSEQGGLETRAA